MGEPIVISIILCTCNRPQPLAASLACLARVNIHPDWRIELVIVDNAPSEQTAAVVRDFRVDKFELAYVPEPKRGKSNALNTGIARSRGEFLLFTDDDVTVPVDWVEKMIAAFQATGCDAVAGRIQLAPELERAWLTPLQRWWLAAPIEQHADEAEVIGANMALRRSVLQKVPALDPELGPGALGRGEEALFCMQMKEADCRVIYAPDAAVVHNPGAVRLQRREWLDMARKLGWQQAYIHYHWLHKDLSSPGIKAAWLTLKLWVRRFLQPPPPREAEGCAAWEMSYVQEMEMCRQFCVESKRQRNYTRRGLVKLVT